jgi:hypothetical protein
MVFNKLIGSSVGADLSRPSPIYRPLMDTLNSTALNPSGEMPPVGAGVVWSGVGTLASPLVELAFSPRFSIEAFSMRPYSPCSASRIV